MTPATTSHWGLRLKQSLGWVVAILPLCLRAAVVPDAPSTNQTAADLSARQQAAQVRLGQVKGSLNALDTNLCQVTNIAALDLASLKAQGQTLVDQQTAQRRLLADLENQIDILRKAQVAKTSKTNAPLSDLQNQLKAARQELERLAQEEARILAQAGNQAITATLGRTKILGKEMRPVYVAFIKSRVLPVRAPYYKTTLDFSGSSPVRLSPHGVGELIGQATKLGGCLDLLLKESSPKTNYFHFWVCPDSISAFHAARQFALTNKYTYTWSTYNGGNFFPAGSENKVRGTGATQ